MKPKTSNRLVKRTLQWRSIVPSSALILLMNINHLRAEDAPAPPVLRLPPIAKAPVVDGRISPGEWDGAFQGYGVIRHRAPNVLEVRKTRYWLAYDNERVYLAMQTELPPWGKLDGKRRRSPIDAAYDDELELFVNPARAPGSPDESYYQLLGNFAGTMMNFIHNPKVSGSIPFNGDVEFVNLLDGGYWTAELAVRAEDFAKAQLVNGQTWGFNFTRYWHNPHNYSAWPTIDYLGRSKYLQVTLDKAAPVVQLENLGDPQGGKPGFSYVLFNPTASPIPLAVHMKVSDGGDKNMETTRQVTLAPGAREHVAWQTPWTLGANNLLQSEITSPDGAIRYFTMKMPFDRDNGRKFAWEQPEQKVAAGTVTLTPLFYPTHSKLRCQINFAALPMPDLVSKAIVTVKDSAGKEIARQVGDRFDNGETELVVALPKALATGRYTAALTLLAGGKEVGDKVLKTFEKRTFPFENNTIGISDKVLFPWTPMKVANNTVQCWNRSLTIGSNGFFQQVKTGPHAILNRPIHLSAVSGGKTLSWHDGPVSFPNKTDSAVDFSATSANDKVKADIACHSEFDGMFKYTVTLTPRGDGKVGGLDLVVPLKEEYAWLLHGTSDGCRTNASLFTPRGTGKVWDSTQVQQWRLTGTFIPYLWLGNDLAGLCWWADSEKGWVRPLDKKSPQVEVRRQKGEVQMVFHLIGRPFQLKEPRTLVFAFNATPVRPRPQWARSWTNQTTAADGYLKGPHTYVYGSCDWVSLGKVLPDRPYTYSSLRPISEEADKWLQDYAATKHKEGRTLIPYTDIITRAVDRGDEVKYYASEWSRYNVPHTQEEAQGWPSNGGPGSVSMTQSRIDYDLWCMKHDAELGVDGFYFDEIQTVGQANPVAGLGFVDETGNVEPETSLFALRTYFKRLYTLLQEKGHQEPFIMPHSSSTMFAGPLAFATIPMDLEMSSPDPDPMRGQIFGIGEPYAMTNVMAWQHGFAGSGMVCPYPGADFARGDYRLARTFVGTMLLFDCRAIFGIPQPVGYEFDRQLGLFGIDRPGVEYVPYWRAGDLQTTGPERVHVSLFRNGNKAMLAMYNDSPKPVTALWKPTDKFGFKGAAVLLDKMDPQDKSKGELPSTAEGLQVELGAYDYRLVQVGTSGTWGPKDKWGPVSQDLFERNATNAK